MRQAGRRILSMLLVLGMVLGSLGQGYTVSADEISVTQISEQTQTPDSTKESQSTSVPGGQSETETDPTEEAETTEPESTESQGTAVSPEEGTVKEGPQLFNAEQTSTHIATYLGKTPVLDGVVWASDVEDDMFSKAFSTVQIKDTAGTVYTVEVVPENLVYFIDSGTGTDWKTIMAGTSDAGAARNLVSEAYAAVKALAGDSLLNEVSDQAYVSGKSWGIGYVSGGTNKRADPIQTYWNNNVAPADGSTITNKFAAGLRASNNTNFEYYLTLEAGTYTLTTGFHEFYNGNHNRGMVPKLYDGETLIATLDSVSMSNNANSSAAPDMVSSSTFTLEKTTLVKVHYEKTSGENGSMNWLAVSKGEIPVQLDRSALRTAIRKAEALGDLSQYASHSRNVVSNALDNARKLYDGKISGAVQGQLDMAAKSLSTICDNVTLKEEDPGRYSSVPVSQTWLDTEGDPIQAHGGGFLQQMDSDGTPIYYWVGEDKTHDSSNFNGVNLYSSKDLLNWTYRSTILQPDYENPGLNTNKVERPKLIYNEKTQTYVLYGHWEDASGYSSSQICVATSKTVDGQYTFLGHWRPGADADHRNWRATSNGNYFDGTGEEISDYSDEAVWGTGSRDFTLYSDGTEAYLVSAQNGTVMRIYRLKGDFTDVDPSMTYQLFDGGRREAPALVKSGEYYYMISSGQSGWLPNQTRYSYTKDITDPDSWAVEEGTQYPIGCLGNNVTFYSQPTNIMAVTGSEGTSYVYMGDHWNSKKLGSSTYVWLPLTIDDSKGAPVMTMDYQSGWSLDVATGKVVAPQNTLISEGKPAFSDAKEQDAEHGISVANDGNYFNTKVSGDSSSYFKPVTQAGGTDAKVPFTYGIDLEGTYDLSRIDLSFRCYNGSEAYYQYTVDVSNDKVNWNPVVDAGNNKEVGFTTHSLEGTTARYVRISVSKVLRADNNSSASWAAGLVEMQVYGEEARIELKEGSGLTAQAFKIAGEEAVNNVLLKWERDNIATEYRIYRAASEAELVSAEPVAVAGDVNNYTLYGLDAADGTWYYQVRGYNGGEVTSETVTARADTYAKLPAGMSVTDGWSSGWTNAADSGSAVAAENTAVLSSESGWTTKLTRTGTAALLYSTNDATGETVTYLDASEAATAEKYPELADCKFESVSWLDKGGRKIIWAHYEKSQGYSTGALVMFSFVPGDAGSLRYSGLVLPNGTHARDKSIFMDGGKAYLIAAGNEEGESANRTIYIHQLTSDWEAVDTEAGVIAKVFEGGFREAPVVIKDQGIYYMFASQAAGWLPSKTAYISATSLEGPWSEEAYPADASSFSCQTNGSWSKNGNHLLTGSRWWRSENSGSSTVMPLQLNNGFATATFFEKVYRNESTGVIIPELSGKNLSQGKTATMKSSGNTADASKTVDGDYNTMAEGTSSTGTTEWVVDLEEKSTLKGIQISWYLIKGSEPYYPYKVYGSQDGSSWTEIADHSGLPQSNNTVDYGFAYTELKGNFRYVKLEILAAIPQNNLNNRFNTARLWEVKVLGAPYDSSQEGAAATGIETELPKLVAARVGQPAENLPEKVTVKFSDNSTKEFAVNWDNDGTAFDEAYVQKTVTGSIDCETESGLPLSVSVPVLVVPDGLKYYVDAGTGSDWANPPAGNDKVSIVTSLAYTAVAALSGSELINQTSDQIYNMAGKNNTWGAVVGTRSSNTSKTDPLRSPDGQTATELLDPYAVGLRTGNTSISYKLELDEGSYTLTTGSYDWYGSRTRVFNPKVTYTDLDGKQQTITMDAIAMPADTLTDRQFTLPAHTGGITLIWDKASGEAPLFSWFAVSEKGTDELQNTLRSLIDQIQADVKAAQENGTVYAESPLQPGQYTGAGDPPKDSLKDLNEAIAAGEELLKNPSATAISLGKCIEELKDIFENLRTMPGTYTDIPGKAGDVIYASNTGLAMQAHGGSATVMKEGTGEGCVNVDLDGDGQITEGKTVYLWYGENKTNNTCPVDGVRCYVSTDLYNWVDRGNVLYLQNSILPIEESGQKAVTSSVGASGTGTTQNYNAMQVSKTNLETLKSWGRMETAPEGVSEEDFGNVKLFLRAYVTEFDKEPTGLYDTSWTAKSYDETVITASSFLYPDSAAAGTVTTTPLQLAFEALYGDYCITERPKMIYNESTGKFVIVFHADGVLYNNEALNQWVAGGCQGNCSASRYSRAMVGFAESDTPFGPFKLVNVTRMNYDTALNSQRLGESRDMTVFVDEGVDKNNDGVDDAYVIYSSEMNAKLYVSLLNKDYTGPAAAGDTADDTQMAARIVSDNSREAPAVFKFDGWYYLITSGTDGWNSTAHVYYRSQNLLSGWEKMGNPAKDDTGKCFDTQVTWVLPVDAETGKFIYMGDRWNGSNLTDSRTIWLPLQVTGDHTLSILNRSHWTVDELDSLCPTIINTEMPEFIYNDGSNLPDTLNVNWQGKTVDSPVVWDTSALKNFGRVSLTGTLTGCENATAAVSVMVVPKDLVYFVNPSTTPLSADYEAIAKANEDTLKSSENDGAYNADRGFGYTGTEGKVRGTNADIYQSMRYAANKSDSITYQFDLDAGKYEVYVGMFNPSSWVTSSSNRRADILINGEKVTTGYQYLNNINDTLSFNNITMDKAGAMTVTVAPNASTNEAVQVSFIMVVQKELFHVHTPEVVGKKDATCTEEGYTGDTICSECGELLEEGTVIPKLPHTEVIDPAKEATCTETGLTEGKHCSVCGEVIVKQEVVPMVPHTEVIDPAKEATCTETGLTEGKHCSVCGEVIMEQEVVPMVPHTEVIDPAKEATCTETGLTEGKHCSVCGEVLVKQEVIPAKGHSWDEGKVTIPPTEDKEGEKTYTCTVCYETKTEVIDKLIPEPSTEPSETENESTEPSTDPVNPPTGDGNQPALWIVLAALAMAMTALAAAGFKRRKSLKR
ncbi:family 43 glycosylhydrolase [Cuneatibacter caecimuris]|uniref:Ig-like protein group 4 n=1 Tax=Cuneatibacter caecimuris TaxID=1796618 RepID=A0A4Q7P3N4_9FIRM|nr:family 43 glycosylhydrolase [Cuneatibacter caecimuris]RZS94435.1 Ig-like protein group 4 [Cuneatibacter caecimuris]